MADFGLSEDVYARNYFRQTKRESESDLKMPVKWMALESLQDGMFTESTDVVGNVVGCHHEKLDMKIGFYICTYSGRLV